MTVATQTFSALRRLAIVIGIAIAFLFGLATTVYLSLRSPEVKVPEIVGKDRFVAEKELQDAGLNFRVRATRPSNQVKSDTVMFQLPHAGEVVKAGQTVAVDVARPAKEGEASEAITPEANTNTANANENSNSNGSPPANDNKTKRNKNSNANNTNGNSNNNRNANANRPNANARVNSNVNRGNANSVTPNANNGNRPVSTENANTNRPPRNVNRATPAPVPTPPGP